jgi:signal transduction histidine kinase
VKVGRRLRRAWHPPRRRFEPADLSSAITRGLCTIVGARAGFLLTRQVDGSWVVEASAPAGAALDPDALAAISSEVAGDEVTRIDDLHARGVTGLPDDTGLAIRIAADAGAPRILVALGLDDPGHPRGVGAIQALADLSTKALDLVHAHVETEVVRSRATSLVAAGMVLSADLNLDDVLQRLVDTAREVLGCRYAALGVLDADKRRLESFVVSGLTPAQQARIGDLPSGRGLLGALFDDSRPIRIDTIADDPRSVGFPAGHPAMTSFLGLPIRVGTEVFGNLYMTDKAQGPFTEEDEFVALTLAAQAAVAIANARRYGEKEHAALVEAQGRERAAEEGLLRAIEAQEAERARVARELHDELGQEMTALALQLRAMDDHVTSEAGRAGLASARHTLMRTTSSLRRLALELRPSGLKEHGLASALERQVSRLHEASDIDVAVALDAIPASLPEHAEIALFRVVQEALTNIARHSRARHASVSASHVGGRLRLVVEDDGHGFDPSAPTERLGLVGMRERMELVGGELRIESGRRSGTTVILELEVPGV